MRCELNQENIDLMQKVHTAGGATDLSNFQILVMLEFLIGDDRQEEFNDYFNERVSTLLHHALSQVKKARLARLS